MKLISFLLFFISIGIHDARKKSTPRNVLRIPLTMKTRTHTSRYARSQIILDDWNSLNQGQIWIGEPKQLFNVVFDTGSTELWVYSSNYDTCNEFSAVIFGKQKLYNRESSTKYTQTLSRKKRPIAQLIQYTVEWVFGFRANDVITLADRQIKMDFLEVTKAGKGRTSSPENGVVGLKYDPKRGNIVSEFCKQIQGENKFSLYLPRYKWKNKTQKGELVLCGVDVTKFKEDTMKYFDEKIPGRWHIAIDSVLAEDVTMGSKVISPKTTAILDSGANRIGGPATSISGFYDFVNQLIIGSDKEVHCDSIHLLPNMTFRIGETSFTLQGHEYIRKAGSRCRVAVVKGAAEHWILGEPFLRKYYTVFDMEKHRIGIADSIK